jgi:hypothetical protein
MHRFLSHIHLLRQTCTKTGTWLPHVRCLFLLSCHSKLKLASVYILPFCPSKTPYSIKCPSFGFMFWDIVLVSINHAETQCTWRCSPGSRILKYSTGSIMFDKYAPILTMSKMPFVKFARFDLCTCYNLNTDFSAAVCFPVPLFDHCLTM